MTLKEKFQKWHDSPTNETVAENIIELENITYDYALEFVKWFDKSNYGIEVYKTLKTYEQVLEIFKKNSYENK